MAKLQSAELKKPHGHSSRRDFLAGLAAVGASSLISSSGLSAQTSGGAARLIDVHQHFVSPEYFAAVTRKNGGNASATWRDYTPAKNIEALDKAGVATAMVSPTSPGVWFGDVMESRRMAREINEYAAAKMVGVYKGRFGLFASLPLPDVDGSLREIEYAFDTLKADGVGILTSYEKMWLGDPAMAPVFDELNRRKAVVYTHPTDAACCPSSVPGVNGTVLEYPVDTARTIMSLIVSGTATRCPDIKFIFSHAGGAIVSVAGRFLGADEVTAEKLGGPAPANSRLHHLRRFYYDTAGSANPIAMQSLKMLVPASQIVFGTDFPIRNHAENINGLQGAGLTAEQLRGIYRENAARILPKYAS